MYAYSNRRHELVALTHRLYERAWRRGQIYRIWAKLTGKPTQLPLLSDVRGRYSVIDTLTPARRPIRS